MIASLGQVYQTQLHNGRLVTVKIQQPDGTKLLCINAITFKLVWAIFNKLHKRINNGVLKGLVMEIVDWVKKDMTKKFGYVLDAQNAKGFELLWRFVGFVKTPDIVEEYLANWILMTEWVNGGHLKGLESKK